MRIVSNRCHTVEYTVTTASPCAIHIEPSVIGARRSFHDCLLVTIGVDRGDRALAGTAVQLVRRIVTESDAGPIVVEGFACLPRPDERASTPAGFDVLSEFAEALDVLTEVTERLEERGEQVHLMPFGWYKNCRVDPLDGIGTQQVIHMSADDNRQREPMLRWHGPRSRLLAHSALAAGERKVCVSPERGRR
ncbi:threonyl-tRNA synthetase editing domain-containing protein [Nocardia sp. NPDC049707]|uniref:threonyl-tRNA synthetase editing domain-containing protein n=1 Tax=Nocardia sp. NPDC049707 TaxID=3154735 RepID=UPI003439CA66